MNFVDIKSRIKLFIKRHIPSKMLNFLILTKTAILSKKTEVIKREKIKHIYEGFPLEITIGDREGKSWYDQDWVRDEIKFLQQNKLKEGACVFNIGAHQCIVALILSRIVGYNGLVVAVEMDAHHVALAKINKRNNRADNLQIVHAAAAEKMGGIFFEGGRIRSPSIKWGGTKVHTISVDNLSNRYGPPDLLFVDVEGYECHVLRGAQKTLRYYPDCCIEVHVGCGLENYNGSVSELITYFPKDKYTLYMAPATHKCNFIPFNPASYLTKERFYLTAFNNKPKG